MLCYKIKSGKQNVTKIKQHMWDQGIIIIKIFLCKTSKSHICNIVTAKAENVSNLEIISGLTLLLKFNFPQLIIKKLVWTTAQGAQQF